MILELEASRLTSGHIADELNRRGVRTFRGLELSRKTASVPLHHLRAATKGDASGVGTDAGQHASRNSRAADRRTIRDRVAPPSRQ